MVIKGSARAAPGELAYHLLREDTNERVTVLELSGVASLDLREALAELDGMGAGSRSRRTLYHASINTPVSEQLNPEQQRLSRERLAGRMGLADQPYVVVEHVKNGRQHTHVVWSRVDVETGRAIHDGFNYRKHEEVARELEREFGHERVLGAHVRDKEREPRPERATGWAEQRQAERSGLTPQAAKAAVSYAWDLSQTGAEFIANLREEGFAIARGDRRDFVLVDAAGEVHGLTRRLSNVTAAEVRHKMRDVERESLFTVEDVRLIQFQKHVWQVEREQVADLARVEAAYSEEPGFVSAIERQRLEEWETSSAPQGLRDAAAAIHELKQTMGHELGNVIVTNDRRTADRTWQQVLREGMSIEERAAFHGGLRRPDVTRERLPEPEPSPEPEAQRPSAVLFEKVFGWVAEQYRNLIEREETRLEKLNNRQEPTLDATPAETRRETYLERMRRLEPISEEELAAERQKQELAAQRLRDELQRDGSRQRVWEPEKKG